MYKRILLNSYILVHLKQESTYKNMFCLSRKPMVLLVKVQAKLLSHREQNTVAQTRWELISILHTRGRWMRSGRCSGVPGPFSRPQGCCSCLCGQSERNNPPPSHSCLWEGGQGRRPSSFHLRVDPEVAPITSTSIPSAITHMAMLTFKGGWEASLAGWPGT